jgi:NADPH:quinone reductase-like Zn-dependent oxidoreductase
LKTNKAILTMASTKQVGFVVRKASKDGQYPYEVNLEPLPQPSSLNNEAGEVVVQVLASALNHRDNWITQGAYPGIREGIVLGSDCVGTVVAASDAEGSKWKGKRVLLDPTIGWPRGRSAAPPGKILILGMPQNGSFASSITIPRLNLRLAPDFLNDAQAAALPLAGVTAYRAMVTKGCCTKDSMVLVTGVGGGVAVFAVQIAVALGAQVYVTSSSEEKLARAKQELGVAGGVNYRDEKWASELLKLTRNRKFDIIIDGAGDISACLKVTNGGGKIVTYGSTASPSATVTLPQLFLNQIELLGTAMGSPEDFDGLLALVNAKKIIPVVDEVFRFEDFPKALDKMRRGGQFGKLVLSHTEPFSSKL